MTKKTSAARPGRRHILAAGVALLGLLAAVPHSASAQGASGEIVILNWQSGDEHQMLKELETAFQKANPKVTFREINAIGQGDPRGGIRAALMAGEKADLLVNTWPAFRSELADSDMLRALDAPWNSKQWSKGIADKWRRLGQYRNVSYGLPFTYGDRSGIFYRPDVLKKSGLAAPPKTWAEFLGSFPKIRAATLTPVAMPAKVWAHAEWFESLLLRTGGLDTMARLAAHKIAWTDPAVKTATKRYAEMLRAGCCDSPQRALATEWDGAADAALKAGTHGYNLIGMWVNGRMKDFGLKEGADYAMFQFPALGAGHDELAMIDAKEFLALKSGKGGAAADAFLEWMGSAEAARIVANHGLPSTSNFADAGKYGPVIAESVRAVSSAKGVQWVLGDLLPGDLADEYRVQLQRLIQDPSDANIDRILGAIEAKAAVAYQK